ncbi:TPA: exo-alpha-sialidase, partial [Candidatus Latescibacteria bacterium]|nr:exo-alpha-sialidase [Candidatus Latescibacterota bacterium]
PAGDSFLFVPCPGGQMRFHILYDEPTKLYWLLGSVATDSTCRPDRLPEKRYNLPNNERHIQGLHYSTNCFDWIPAGIVAKGNTPGESRHYASMVIDGDDLHVLSRSGDYRAKSAHDGNLITVHTVQHFRDLILI